MPSHGRGQGQIAAWWAMGWVIWRVGVATRLGQEKLSLHLGLSKAMCSHYIAGLCGPSSAVARRILKLVSEHQLGAECEAIYNARLRCLHEREERKLKERTIAY